MRILLTTFLTLLATASSIHSNHLKSSKLISLRHFENSDDVVVVAPGLVSNQTGVIQCQKDWTVQLYICEITVLVEGEEDKRCSFNISLGKELLALDQKLYVPNNDRAIFKWRTLDRETKKSIDRVDVFDMKTCVELKSLSYTSLFKEDNRNGPDTLKSIDFCSYVDGFDVIFQGGVCRDLLLCYYSFDLNGNQIDQLKSLSAPRFIVSAVTVSKEFRDKGILVTSLVLAPIRRNIDFLVDGKVKHLVTLPTEHSREVHVNVVNERFVAICSRLNILGFDGFDLMCIEYDLLEGREIFRKTILASESIAYRALKKGGIMVFLREYYDTSFVSVDELRPDGSVISYRSERLFEDIKYRNVRSFDEETNRVIVDCRIGDSIVTYEYILTMNNETDPKSVDHREAFAVS